MKLMCSFALLMVVAATQGKSLVKRGDNERNLPSIPTGYSASEFERMLGVNMNDYVDKMIGKAKDFMIEHGLDPYELPDITKSFSATDLIGINWHGELDLKKGWAQDLSTIYRSGDVTLEYDHKTMTITANLGFTDLTFNYDFSAKIMNLGPTGNLDGKADQVQIVLKVAVDLDAKTVSLQDFSIGHVGDVKIEFSGMGSVLDWIMDGLTKIALDIFKGPILGEVQKVVRGAIEDVLADIDIGDFLPPVRHHPKRFTL